jgi:hypothetical protein
MRKAQDKVWRVLTGQAGDHHGGQLEQSALPSARHQGGAPTAASGAAANPTGVLGVVPGPAIRRAGGGYDPCNTWAIGWNSTPEELSPERFEGSGAFDLSNTPGLKLLIYPYIKIIIKKKTRSNLT